MRNDMDDKPLDLSKRSYHPVKESQHLNTGKKQEIEKGSTYPCTSDIVVSLKEKFSKTRENEETVQKGCTTNLHDSSGTENNESENKDELLTLERNTFHQKRSSKLKRCNVIKKENTTSAQDSSDEKNDGLKENSTSDYIKIGNSLVLKRKKIEKPVTHSGSKQIQSDSFYNEKHKDNLVPVDDSEYDERSTSSCDYIGPSTSTRECCNFYSSITRKSGKAKSKPVTDSGDIKPKSFDSSSDDEHQHKSRIVDDLDCGVRSTATGDCSEPSTSTGECCNFHASKDRKKITKEKKRRNYACRYCNYVFNKKQSCISHERTHTGEKPFECQHCKTRFRRKDALERHMLSQHTENGPFACKECDGSFTTKYDLNQHEITHYALRPYKCSKCPKAFNRQGNFVEHEKVHIGKRPHKCAICGKGFPYKCILNRHNCTSRRNKKK